MGDTLLVMRSCDRNRRSYNGFQWPESGPVDAPDWDPTPVCGGGLHGLLPGQNEPGQWYDDGLVLLVEVAADDVVVLGGKIKFRRGNVVFCGKMRDACIAAEERGCYGPWYKGTASAGYKGTASAGYKGTASAGDGGTASAGYMGTASAGDGGTASAGYMGTASAGDGGTASAGYKGTASAGYMGTASAGDWGTASAGYMGTASAGDGGTLLIRWWDSTRYRVCVGYVGEDKIEPNTQYVVVDGKLRKKDAARTRPAGDGAAEPTTQDAQPSPRSTRPSG